MKSRKIPKIKISNSLKWLLSGRAIQVLLQLASISVLARVLTPEDFGLMAVIGIVTTFAQFFLDMGMNTALIQKENLEDQHSNSVFWASVGLSIIITTTINALSPVLAFWMGDPRLIPALAVSSLGFPLAALGATHVSLLERKESFRTLTIIKTYTSFIGFLLAFFLALYGAGVYALIAQTLAITATSTLLFWRTEHWRPKKPSTKGIKEISSFSANVFLFNILNYIHRNADTAIIGRFIGQQDLGIYNVAYRTMLFPLQNLTFAINRALLPAYSRSQSNISDIYSHYILTLRGIALVTAPVMAAIWSIRESIVVLFLGENWLRAADIIQWLAPVGFLQSIISTSGTIFTACGRHDILRNMGIIGVPFLTSSFFIGLPRGIDGIAQAYCIANLIWIFPVMFFVVRVIGGNFKNILFAITLPTLISIFSFFSSREIIELTNFNEIVKATLTVIFGSSLFFMGVKIYLWNEFKLILKELSFR